MTLFDRQSSTSISGYKQCNKCGDIFPAQQEEYGLCPVCATVERSMFQRVNNAMRFGEKLQPEDLARRCSVNVDIIYRWINEGRFGS